MLTYDTLHSELNTESARELEDLVIEAVYHVSCFMLLSMLLDKRCVMLYFDERHVGPSHCEN